MAGRKVAEFLAHYQPGILNIAGNREASSPGISSWVFTVLGSAWNQYDEVSLSATPRCEQTCLALPGFDRPSRSRSF
ncbi:hypothetical protein OPIT5_00055 (plasmid) [Opitutaceae bacterium TAV5]|nr:hypothetical protein OPIT5_00055 [Opitutaceae bacterium TAV5]